MMPCLCIIASSTSHSGWESESLKGIKAVVFILYYLSMNLMEQKLIAMKQKVLELSFDAETQNFDIISEINPFAGLDPDKKESEEILYGFLDKLVELLLDKHSLVISSIVKTLTMADICADVQPYEHIEDLWSLMMFRLLPDKEKHFRKMKEERGFRVKVIEPKVFGNFFSSFPITKMK